MRSLHRPAVSDAQLYDDIRRAKKGLDRRRLGLQTLLIGRAYGRYQAYGAAGGLSRIGTAGISGVYRAALIRAYENSTAPLEGAIDELRVQVGAVRCPYCSVNEARDIDHWAPKESFPEFSVFSLNLVPACNQCNSRHKGRRFRSHGDLLFVHPYFHFVPKRAFLLARVRIVGGVVDITYRLSSSAIPPAMRGLLGRHFDGLSLGARYRNLALERFGDEIPPLRRIHVGLGTSAVRAELSRKYSTERKVVGPNHWMPAMYLALSRSKLVCGMRFTDHAPLSPNLTD